MDHYQLGVKQFSRMLAPKRERNVTDRWHHFGDRWRGNVFMSHQAAGV